jgi:alpha,alpha-trehalose phosphorylase
MASLAGGWLALVAGFGGMRAGVGALAFSPRLPDGISRLAFRMRYRGRKLSVTIRGDRVRYELMEGEPLPVTHHGEEFELGRRAMERKVPPVKAGPRPEQPHGRPPYSRGSGS